MTKGVHPIRTDVEQLAKGLEEEVVPSKASRRAAVDLVCGFLMDVRRTADALERIATVLEQKKSLL